MYFGEGDRVHVIFNFFVNQHFFLAMAREDATPILQAYAALPKIPAYASGRISCGATMNSIWAADR